MIQRQKIYLGRQEEARSDRSFIDITVVPFAERVSRLHAYITWDDRARTFAIADNDSTNGTILNNQSLIAYRPSPLQNGDLLEFGREHKIVFRVEIN